MIILDLQEGLCFIFYLCNDANDHADHYFLWSDYFNEYCFKHDLANHNFQVST